MRSIAILNELAYRCNQIGKDPGFSQLEWQALCQREDEDRSWSTYSQSEWAAMRDTGTDNIFDEDQLRTPDEQEYYYDKFVDKFLNAECLQDLASARKEFFALPLYATSKEAKQILWQLYYERKDVVMNALIQTLSEALEKCKDFRDLDKARELIFNAPIDIEEKRRIFWDKENGEYYTARRRVTEEFNIRKAISEELCEKLKTEITTTETVAELTENRKEYAEQTLDGKMFSKHAKEVWDTYSNRINELQEAA